MNTRPAIIARDTLDGTQFWTGTHWSAEYPDAAEYTRKEARQIERGLGRLAYTVTGYGYDNEQTT